MRAATVVRQQIAVEAAARMQRHLAETARLRMVVAGFIDGRGGAELVDPMPSEVALLQFEPIHQSLIALSPLAATDAMSAWATFGRDLLADPEAELSLLGE